MNELRTSEQAGRQRSLSGGMVHARVAMCPGRQPMPTAPACAYHRTRRGKRQIIAVILAAFLVSAGCSRDKENNAGGTFLSAANGIPLPEFTVTRADGKTVTKADFLGTVWVADFIFTTCAGPCPELSLRMRSLQQGLERFGTDAKSASFSVDPTYDKPGVLRAYGKRYNADADRWWFLTSEDEAAMHELVTAGFLQALSPSRGGSTIIHSTRFVLVDRVGRIRGWYDGLKPASKAAIIRSVEALLREPTGT